ncbi:hypothetical protein BB559_000013 [Furculomyces boomerangus]|uniref:Uncharacterized protein n=1 Tax=Furculomyces boomerangus TaxID=61424 RepID=A0A2T9Z6Q6_9FUNG|nr:hypothetical protein BB559_000013 [Furculomyces boomerangus]
MMCEVRKAKKKIIIIKEKNDGKIHLQISPSNTDSKINVDIPTADIGFLDLFINEFIPKYIALESKSMQKGI